MPTIKSSDSSLTMARLFKRLRRWIRNNPEDSTPVMIAGAIILMAAMALAYRFLF
jgi:cytochrome c-type biogenesis protein CcmH/NrfG